VEGMRENIKNANEHLTVDVRGERTDRATYDGEKASKRSFKHLVGVINWNSFRLMIFSREVCSEFFRLFTAFGSSTRNNIYSKSLGLFHRIDAK
jgi:hypothetical protein